MRPSRGGVKHRGREVVPQIESQRGGPVSHRRMQAKARVPPKKPQIPPSMYSSCCPTKLPKMPLASNPKTHMAILLAIEIQPSQ